MKLVVDKASLVSVADAIREKGNTTDELEFPNGFVDGINAIESGGGGTEEIENIIDQSGVLESTDGTSTATEKVEQLVGLAEWEKAWYKQTENMTTAQRLFYNFTDYSNEEGYRTIPRTNFVGCTNFASFCENSNIDYIDYLIAQQVPYEIQVDRMFFGSNVKRILGVKAKIISAVSMFHASSIEEIVEPLDFSAMTISKLQNAFTCSNLREVRFVSETIKWSTTFSSAVLSDESIKSILRGLAPVETTQTLKVSQIVFNKLLENEFYDYWDEALNKGWDITN